MPRLKRQPTKEELEFTKWMRSYKPGNLSQEETEFMDQAYFDIQDGVSEYHHTTLIQLAKKYSKFISRELLFAIVSSETRDTTPKPIKSRHESELDLHFNIMTTYYSFGGRKRINKDDVRLVLREVCRKLNTDYEKSLSKARYDEFVRARQITALLCKKRCSYLVIGKALNRDHATIMHAVNKLSQEMQVNDNLREQVYTIKKQLGL